MPGRSGERGRVEFEPLHSTGFVEGEFEFGIFQ